MALFDDPSDEFTGGPLTEGSPVDFPLIEGALADGPLANGTLADDPPVTIPLAESPVVGGSVTDGTSIAFS